MANLKERLAKKRKDLEANRGGTFKFFRIVEGTTRYRACPVGEEKEWAIEAVVFYLGKKLGYIISPHTFGGKCAVMNAYEELSNSKKEADKKFAKTFKPSKKFFSPQYRYKDEKGKEVDTDAGVKLLMLTPGQYQDMIDFFLDDELGDFTDREEGYDIKHQRTGKTMTDTEYSMRPCQKSKAYRKFTKEEIDVEEMVKAITPSYKETKTLLEEFLNIDPEEDDEPPKKKKKKKSDL